MPVIPLLETFEVDRRVYAQLERVENWGLFQRLDRRTGRVQYIVVRIHVLERYNLQFYRAEQAETFSQVGDVCDNRASAGQQFLHTMALAARDKLAGAQNPIEGQTAPEVAPETDAQSAMVEGVGKD